ncbi:MAG: type 4a pilus biogenesis protein PilO, partial [Deltaproteobacteria bacterium]|nr:type 4a pilus biogenesis protein PilO [Deltaproteobacteria bacterium]
MIGKTSNGVIYGLIVIALVNIGFYYGLVLPQMVKADRLFKEIEARRAEAIAFKSPSSFAEIKADIEKFKRMLPRKTEMPKIIREIDGLAKSASLSIHDISYESGKGEKDGIYPVSFSFPLEGKYSLIKNFIYK